ncbi:division/cell wall cluster transcriptional repressor MraZ [Thermophilibacter sp.]
MLAGSYPMSVDAKARVTLPAVFRKQLVNGDSKTIYLLPLKECVNGFTPEGLEQFIDGLFIENGENRFDSRSRKDVQLKTRLWASAVEVDIDSAGRVALGKLDAAKAGTRERLGLLADVTVVGAGDHFEVWNTDEWNATQESFDDELDALLYHD